ncbi:hypothetical protein ACQP1G_24860 [Nocardia sp. CA-107356]|uniref:hypothetical protein n=1 Tax=Nocardia sp. CA-107356 TaxID=3239972 RepID=UPI003D8C54F8
MTGADRVVVSSDVAGARVVVSSDTAAAPVLVVVSSDVAEASVLVTGLEAGVVVDAAVELLVETDPVTVALSWQALAPRIAAASTTAEIATLTYDPSYLDGRQDHTAGSSNPAGIITVVPVTPMNRVMRTLRDRRRGTNILRQHI